MKKFLISTCLFTILYGVNASDNTTHIKDEVYQMERRTLEDRDNKLNRYQKKNFKEGKEKTVQMHGSRLSEHTIDPYREDTVSLFQDLCSNIDAETLKGLGRKIIDKGAIIIKHYNLLYNGNVLCNERFVEIEPVTETATETITETETETVTDTWQISLATLKLCNEPIQTQHNREYEQNRRLFDFIQTAQQRYPIISGYNLQAIIFKAKQTILLKNDYNKMLTKLCNLQYEIEELTNKHYQRSYDTVRITSIISNLEQLKINLIKAYNMTIRLCIHLMMSTLKDSEYIVKKILYNDLKLYADQFATISIAEKRIMREETDRNTLILQEFDTDDE